MNTFEFDRGIKSLFAEFESFQPFTAALLTLTQSAEAIEPDLLGVAQGSVQLNQHAAQIHAHLANTRTTTATINNRQFFKALEHFQGAISQLQLSHISNAKLISSLNTKVEEFASLYDAFLSNQSGVNALPLLLAAKVLHAKIVTFFDTLQLVDESIGNCDVPSSSEAQLALLLPAHLDLSDFARRLIAIQEMYSELCMLLSVSQSDHPLRISKIESGSLWAKVFGESRVVGLMVSFVEQTASWIFRTYTTEGKIASIPKKIEAIDSLLRLKERLSEAGVDTSDMKEHIEKSAVTISRTLSEILDGQSSVTVNEHTISIGAEMSKGLLDRTAPLRLQNSDQSTSIEPSEPSPT